MITKKDIVQKKNECHFRNPIVVAALTAYGEARGTSMDEITAVLHTIRNRVNSSWCRQDTVQGVCLQPYQFSSWNENDPNLHKMLELDSENEYFLKCLFLAYGVLEGVFPDITSGADHYHDKSIVSPFWAKNMEVTLETENFIFYRSGY